MQRTIITERDEMMNNLKKLQTMNIDQLAEFLDANGHHDAIWWWWFEEKFCEKCETTMTTKPYIDNDGKPWHHACITAYCEENGRCRFFKELDGLPDGKETIRIWLESEAEDNG